MPKTKISEFSATPANNTDIDSINIAEGCAPSGINDAIRELMAQLKDFQTGAVGDSFNGPVGTSTAAAGAFTTLAASGAVTLSGGTANGVTYLNGSKVLTSGSALVFDGTTLGAGVTPSTWSTLTGLQVKNASLVGFSNRAYVVANGYYDGAWKYISTGFSSNYTQNESVHSWFTAPSGTAGNAITFTQAMTLDASGNLLVGGTSSVLGKLEVSVSDNSSTQDGINIRGTQNNAFGGYLSWSDTWSGDAYRGKIAAILGYRIAGGTGALRFFTASGGALNEVGRFDQLGNFLIGKTSKNNTSGNGFQCEANGTINVVTASSNASFDTYEIYSTGAGAYRFYVTAGGVINATSTSITAISDQRLKENVRPLELGLAEVLSLQPRRYDWIEGKGQNKKDAVGFIAQEFEVVLPNSVGTSKAGEDGIEYKNINYEELMPTLVKAIQEQQTLIQSLKARLDAANL